MSSPSPVPSPCAGTVTGGPDKLRLFVEDFLCGRRKLPEVPGDIDMTWTFVDCDGAAGSSYCTYRNNEGSDLILRVPDEAPDRVSEVRMDRTLFPADADAYMRYFIQAWADRNVPRMRALSTPDVAAYAAANQAPQDGYSISRSAADAPRFEVDSAGRDYAVVVSGQPGRPNAITAVQPR